MAKTGRKRSIVLNVILIALIALLAALTALVMVRTLGKGMLPGRYAGIILGVVGAIIVISLIALRRKWSNIVMMIITAAACALMGYGILLTGDINQSIEHISSVEDVKNVSPIKVAVLKDSPLTKFDELSGKQVAYSTLDDTEIIDNARKKLDEKVGGIEYTEVSGISGVADALRNGDVPAAIVNESYIDILSEIDEYEGFSDEIRYLYEFDVETDIRKNETVTPKDPDVFTVFISGIDTYGSPMAASRSDVNIIGVVNMRSKHVQLINTPRDAYVYLPNSGDVKDKLTHAGIYGIDNSMTTISNLYGTDVDYYMRVNFTGFQEIIDAIGGIDVESDYDFTVTGGGFSFEKGMNHLDGISALAFARERKAFAEGDNQRGIDQMKVIEATIKKMTSSPEILMNYQNVLGGLEKSVQTSVPQGNLYKMVNMQLSDSSEWRVDSYSLTGTGTKAETFSMPGWFLYVMIPDENSLNTAKSLIDTVKSE